MCLGGPKMPTPVQAKVVATPKSPDQAALVEAARIRAGESGVRRSTIRTGLQGLTTTAATAARSGVRTALG